MSTVSSGQTLSGATVTSNVTVSAGGSIVSSTIEFDRVSVLSGGSAVGNLVNSSGELAISSGGSASGTTVVSAYLLLSGGSAVATTVSNGGDISLTGGATASGTTVLGFGDIFVNSGATAFGTVLGNGTEIVEGTDSGAIDEGNFEVAVGGVAVGTAVQGTFFEVSGEAISSTIGSTAVTFVYGGGMLISPTVQSSYIPVTVESGGQISDATLQPGASVNLAAVPFVSGEMISFEPATDTLTVTAGGTALATLQLAGSYSGDTFTVSAEPGGATSGSTIVAVKATPAVTSSSTSTTSSGSMTSTGTVTSSGTTRPTSTTNTINVGNAGSVTVTTPGTSINVSTNGPGGTATISVGQGGATVAGSLATAVLNTPGLVTLLPIGNGLGVVPLATSSPLQTALVQDILALGQTVTSRTVYLPGQSFVTSSSVLSTQLLLDLPERTDTITGVATVPVADIVLDNPGATYVTGATGASIVVGADGASATIINNNAGGALIAATGAASNTLEGLAGANQFVTGSGGQDAVLLDGAANALTTNGADAVLVGGPSTVVAAASGLDLVALTGATTLAFVDQSAGAAADTVTGAAGSTIVFAGSGSAVLNAGGGSEGFAVDTSAGNVTLNGALAGGDTFLFVKDASVGSAAIAVTNFTGGDTLAVHGYAAFNVTAGVGGAVLSLSDGSSVTFTGLSVGAIQQAVKVV